MTKAMKCATEIAKLLGEREATGDVCIYVDHKRFTVNEKGNLVLDLEKAEPRDYFEYCGDFLSMSFEGILYDLINDSLGIGDSKTVQDLEKIFNKFGYFSEQGQSWNLSLYKI